MISFYKNLSIRSKIIIVIIVSILVFAATLFVISNSVLSTSYEDIERQNVLKDLSRVHDALGNIISQLHVKLSDWAAWDDTYQFVQDANKEYVTSNLGVQSIALLEINAMVFSDVSGKVLFARAIDIEAEEEVDATHIRDFVESHPEMTLFKNIEDSQEGIVTLPGGAFLFVSQPVVTSERQGPLRGSIMFGSFLDDRIIDSIASLTHLAVDFYPYGRSSSSDVVEAEKNIAGIDDTFVSPLSDESVAAYRVIYDFFGKPILTLRVVSERAIYNQGQLAFYTFAITAGILVLIFGLVLVLLLDRLMIARFIVLSEKVGDIAERNDLSLRVGDGIQDEIGRLALAINHLLEKIALSRDAEKKSSEEAYGASEELRRRVEELEQMNKLMVDRELKMAELKKENLKLKEKVK